MAKKQKSPETRNKQEIIYTTIRLSRCAAGKKRTEILKEIFTLHQTLLWDPTLADL